MIESGELFLLSSQTGGELRPLRGFLSQKVRVLAAALDRAYVAVEPCIRTPGSDRGQCTVWCFRGGTEESPTECPEFDAIEGDIRQIAIGEQHILVLTHDGVVYSRGTAVFGNVGQGGACTVTEFKPVPALRDRHVAFVASGPYFSVAITEGGDVFSWGQAFKGETGLFTQVEAVPRFAPLITPHRVLEVSCGNGHALARTESRQCIAWGENTCGQLGLGQKSKPSYKPYVVETIQPEVVGVSAGWAHSVAVGADHLVYSWGLNSHGQLGLGDTTTRWAPHLLRELAGVHEVLSANAARTFTLFNTRDRRALLCGQVPREPDNQPAPEFEFAPRRPGRPDPPGCVLSPVPLVLASDSGFGGGKAQISHLAAFNKGGLGFARSTVYRVAPNLAPLHGGTQVRAHVTGLPYEPPGSPTRSRSTLLLQETVTVQVHLTSSSPACDVVVPGQIVDLDTVEFVTPDVDGSHLGSVVKKGTTCAVQLRVSIDGGLTWTPDRYAAPSHTEIDETARICEAAADSPGGRSSRQSLAQVKAGFEAGRRATTMATIGSTVLWYCRWPRDGPTHVEPRCATVTGGTELLLHVELPSRMPTECLTVRFLCKPLSAVGDRDLEGKAPMRRDAAEIVNPDADELARLPLAGYLEVPVCAWLDPGSRGVRCVSPPLDAENVKFYEYFVELSLDGHQYLPRALPFSVFDLRITGLRPNLGSLLEATEVRIQATGLVASDIQKVRLDFPKELRWAPRTVPASFDYTTEEIFFIMPDLLSEVRQRVEEARETAEMLADASGEQDPPKLQVAQDTSGGLAGLEVFVELSLNAQNFTEDRITFTYHGSIEPDLVKVLALPEGHSTEPVKDDPKNKSKKVEETAEVALLPGSKIGCTARGAIDSDFAVIRAELATRVGDEEPKLLRVVDLPATVERLTPPTQPSTADPRDKNATPMPEEPRHPVETITALAPAIRHSEFPDGATLLIRHFQVSLSGQGFVACPTQPAMRLEPAAATPPSTS